jgi:hypothetical protein
MLIYAYYNYDGWRYMISLSLVSLCRIDVLVVLIIPYFYPFNLYPLLLSLVLDFNKYRDL